MTYLAVDIGASSGRHIIGSVENGIIKIEEIYRFENNVKNINGHLCWDLESLFESVVAGIAECGKKGIKPESVAIDTWGVDFVLLDKNHKVLGDAVAYRDSRTENMDKKLEKLISPEKLYEKTGIQKQIFNTIYQLMALKEEHLEYIEEAVDFLMIPEYLNYRLTGIMKNEYTNASTTNMLDVRTHEWCREVLELTGIPERLFARQLSLPAETVGKLLPEIAERTGLQTNVILPATHDTGSAFLAVPARDDNAVYISSGTWSLIGVENSVPVTTKESLKANFTNEGGYLFRYRYLKNIMGLWIIQNCRRNWNSCAGTDGKSEKKYSFADLENLARASKYGFEISIDINKQRFLAPENMVAEIADECKAVHGIKLSEPGDIMKCVYVSLAESYKKSIAELSSLTGKTYNAVNIVGGGSKDGYLNELTSKASGLPVIAGPTEGTALGNLIVQFIAGKEFKSLQEARNAIAKSFELKEYK